MLLDTLSQRLKKQHANSLYRSPLIKESGNNAKPIYEQQKYLAFNSNDYLGLSHHPEVIKTFCTVAQQHGIGSGSAHLIAGHTHWHHQLETTLAQKLQCERVLLFSSGYLANLGILQAIPQKNDIIFQDKRNHASLIDARLLTTATTQRYKHLDLTNLEQKLQQSPQCRHRFIVTDSVFSMGGDLAKLSDLLTLAKKYKAYLIIDDAHAFGILGKHGLGSLDHYNLFNQPEIILMGTFGKALGTFGAFVAGTETIIETLIQFSRTYIYTTALPAAHAAATLTSLNLVTTQPEQRIYLKNLINFCQNLAQQLKLQNNEPCLEIKRRTFSSKGVVSFARLIHPSSRFRLGGRFSVST